MYSLLPTITGLIVLVPVVYSLPADSSPVRKLTKRGNCAGSDWDLTISNWNSAGTDAWISRFMESKNGSTLVQALQAKFIPQNRDFNCGLNSPCTIPDCNEITSNDPNAKQAYFVLESISRFTQSQTFQWNGVVAANSLANSFSTNIVETFFVSNIQLSTGESPLMQQLFNVLIAAISIAASYYSLPLIPLLSGSLSNPTKAAQYISNALITAGAISIRASQTKSDLTLSALTTFNTYIGDISNTSEAGIASLTSNLLDGKDDSNGLYLQDYIAGGGYLANIADNGQQTAAQLMAQIMYAGAINTLWKNSYVYIVASPAVNNDCNSDRRGPQDSKFCRDNDTNVYYAMMLGSHGKPHPQVLLPTGYDQMSQYNFTISNAIESSIKAFWAAKFNYENVRVSRWQSAQESWPVGSRPSDLWARFEGVFTIPVCYDPHGTAISSIKKDPGRTYPCSCGQSGNGEDTGAFRTALNFENYSPYTDWCGGPQ